MKGLMMDANWDRVEELVKTIDFIKDESLQMLGVALQGAGRTSSQTDRLRV